MGQHLPEGALELLEKMLRLDPHKRISAEAAFRVSPHISDLILSNLTTAGYQLIVEGADCFSLPAAVMLARKLQSRMLLFQNPGRDVLTMGRC